ncbi:MAG: hypothetical protein C5B49_00010 [Bdellovibrio sp.]|nr:MAG: hypothetical protein C5B49_00010 [Bdellovibrio sp.]
MSRANLSSNQNSPSQVYPTPLSPAQLKLHEQAVKACARHRLQETEIIHLLMDIETGKIHRLLGYSSLFNYSVQALGLSEGNAYAFIAVARKCRECGPLAQAVDWQTLSVSKAARLVSVLSLENAEVLVQFAVCHSSREIDKEVAKLRPRSKANDSLKPLSEKWEKLNCERGRRRRHGWHFTGSVSHAQAGSVSAFIKAWAGR